MIDPNNTSPDWQTHTGDICVLPVGSFEQHGAHLPLCTDILGAEHFALMAARGLDSALLPALPFGTCTEHSGFRGSVSLRPETLMQTVRDIADELERQQFRVLLLVNGHGGNLVLGPVARDINRADRLLKVLLVNWWEYLDATIAAEGKESGPDFHAGAMETSLMLALRPDLVGDERIDAPPPSQNFPLAQADLNTFGMGHFAPSGAVGSPSLATKENGEAILEAVRERMLPHLRDRIQRLHEQPKYAGGGIALRALTPDDLDAAMRLKALAGWNQTENDWRFFLEYQPENCFAAVHNGRVVGTTTIIRYGKELAWIGMVLVDPQFRRMGIGKRLLQRALESASECETIGLDATTVGKELYAGLGFGEEYSLQRFVHSHLPSLSLHEGVLPLKEKHWPAVAELDRRVFGADRSELLKRLQKHQPTSAWCLFQKDRLRGFCLARRGENFHHIGPLVAEDEAAARALLQTALSTLRGSAVGLDVADSQLGVTNFLRELGFDAQRPFIRMTLDGKGAAGVLRQQFAIVGPEFG